ncbi:MAG: hypothetical protein HRU05_10995 [Oceanospirillaceae bacterium]|nr:hypothetical protein [Oceanospirillaceae bacterium]
MKQVVYCDDEQEYLNKFSEKHNSANFQILPTNNIDELPSFLNMSKSVPDLLILDLYHTISAPNSDAALIENKEVEAKLVEVKKVTEELRIIVNRVKRPAAIEAIKKIRDIPRLKNLPIIVYTREGLSILSDNDLNESYAAGAEWMLKGKNKEYEKGRIEDFLNRKQSNKEKLVRDVKIAAISVLASFSLSLGLYFLQ